MKDNNYAPSRNIYYLQGFLNRKKRTIHDAITCYIDSKDCGRKDESLFRELGHCYFLIGEYETAQTYVQKVLKQQKDKKRINFYILDLQIQISMALGDKINAQESIEQLKELEETIYYYRRSRFEFLFGDENKAEEYVSQALNLCNGNPRFEFLSHACNCKISLRKIEDAQTILDEIDQSPRFGKIYGDIRTGLRAKLMIARQKFEQAVQLSGEIVDKSTKPYKTIRRDALKGYLENCVLRDSERNKLSEECRRLDIELSNIDKIKPSLELDEGLDLD